MFDENNIKWTEKVYFIQVWLKRFPLIITKTTENELVHIKCEWANLNQTYVETDLYLLFEDLADMIKEQQLEKKTSTFQMRLSAVEKLKLEDNANKAWYKTISEFIKNKCVF